MVALNLLEGARSQSHFSFLCVESREENKLLLDWSNQQADVFSRHVSCQCLVSSYLAFRISFSPITTNILALVHCEVVQDTRSLNNRSLLPRSDTLPVRLTVKAIAFVHPSMLNLICPWKQNIYSRERVRISQDNDQ